ncbi:MAG: c-type cytochrome [Longimicrobiales bacterium]
MRTTFRVGAVYAPLSLALALVSGWTRSSEAQQTAAQPAGKAVYDKWCAGCHGTDGKGAGPAANYMLPRPRDFTLALYQVRTTATGQLPTDADIRKVIDDGMPGTAMPGWSTVLSSAERDQLVTYLKSFSRFFAQQKEPLQPLDFGRAPGANQTRLDSGKVYYDRIECWKCHGRTGKGDGPSARTQEDDNQNPIRPADLTEPWYFNGGHTVEDIYRRLRTGLDGTPMPSFSDLLDSKFMTDERLWDLALYVRSLAPEKVPRVRDVVRASEIQGALPAAPTDSAWNQAERFYIPLVGQIVLKPRWFAPTVDGVWVQALHNKSELVVRVTWNDPSKSPDPEWSEWQSRVSAFMEPHEEPAGSGVVAPGSGSSPPQASSSAPGAATPASPLAPRLPSSTPALSDALVVQFPVTIPTGMERPYFLMGTAGKPTYLWKWQSDTDAAIEASGKGFGRMEPLQSGQLAARSAFDQGEWSVVFRRPLTSADSANRLVFRTGVAIPMAVFAWDGNNGESGTKGSISTWYYIYLDQKTPKTVYTAPVATIALTAGLGLLFVRRAQRRREDNSK